MRVLYVCLPLQKIVVAISRNCDPRKPSFATAGLVLFVALIQLHLALTLAPSTGFLLALGLRGHLNELRNVDKFDYLQV